METFFNSNLELFILLALWSLPWKGYALWLAARNYHKVWFVVILLTNTIAILDIIYIFAIGRPEYKKLQQTPPEPTT